MASILGLVAWLVACSCNDEPDGPDWTGEPPTSEAPCVPGEDGDLDGLTDCAELDGCTDPADPDTDGDGLEDGAEVELYRTDPCAADTDGGGIDDRTELRDGTDPLDPEDDGVRPTDPPRDTGAPVDTAPTGDTSAGACIDVDLGSVPVAHADTTQGGVDDHAGTCGGAGAPDVGHRLVAPADGRYLVQIEAAIDTVLIVLDGCGGSELACDDVNGAGGDRAVLDLIAGDEVVLVVDGADGPYTLRVDAVPAAESTCDDGLDEDLDGDVDCVDPDCWSAPSCVEVCDDHVDNNQDGLVDCLDPICFATHPPCGIACPDLTLAAPGTLTGDTRGELDDFVAPGTCTFGPSASDVTVAFTAPSTDTWVLDTVGSGFDTVLTLLDGCGGAVLGCDDDTLGFQGSRSHLATPLSAGQTVIAIVDGFNGHDGPFTLNVAQRQAAETDCADERDLDDDGLVDCADPDCAMSFPCFETCDDGVDNNADGQVDCADPLCASDPGCQEICDDAIDNDADGTIDCLDADCAAHPACVEICDDQIDNDQDLLVDCQDADCAVDPRCGVTCPDASLVGALPIVVTDDTTPADDTFAPSCSFNSVAPDLTWTFTAPAAATYTFSTQGSRFDTVLYVLDSCGGTELACNDDEWSHQPSLFATSQVSLALAAGEQVVVVVDGYGSASGPVELEVR